MKKILCLILCIIFASFMLVSCDEEDIGEVPEHYPNIDDTIPEVDLNMYIIVGEGTSSNAIDTVSRAISQYTLKTYHTSLNIKYVSADEYESTMLAAVGATDASAANIVLVNSIDTMNSLIATEKLVDLVPYLDTDDFGTLKVKIPTVLLDAAKTGESLYALPNNHIIGEYEYLVINEEVAKHVLKENPSKLASYNTYESTEELRAEMVQAGYDANQYVYIQNGPYSLKAELEAQGNVCNVVSLPESTAEEAFSSAFAIVNSTELANQRAMEIIYALSSDTELRNLLQYGVAGTNYTETHEDGVSEIFMVDSEKNSYRMNIEYTGNMFICSYCDELGWTLENAISGQKQNEQAILAN